MKTLVITNYELWAHELPIPPLVNTNYEFLENIVIALDSKTSILDSNFIGYRVACKVFEANNLKNLKLIYIISKSNSDPNYVQLPTNCKRSLCCRTLYPSGCIQPFRKICR